MRSAYAGESDALAPDRLRRLEEEVAALRAQLAALSSAQAANRAAFCLISDEFEKVLTVLMLAHSAAAMELETEIYFAFWGVQAVKRNSRYHGKPLLEKALTALLQHNIHGLPSSKLNFAGLGPAIFCKLMRDKAIATPAELMAAAIDAGIGLRACATSMEMLGIAPDELLPGVQCAGASAFVEIGSHSRISLIL